MADFILVDGDMANFLPAFGTAIVAVQPGTLSGTGPGAIGNKSICIQGDESSVNVPGCMYVAPPYVIPGNGTLSIESLAGDQLAKKTNSGGTAVILKGSMFNALFQVNSPAQQPPKAPGEPPTPDSTTQYKGKGMFINNNMKFKGA
ncbi:MAG: hypothetical protein H6557_11920 [Lewinellaceae bacterium]|nr:hypothetical protein [Phaeodactylibacter sp.]MCB9037316.1 hypothetical protein [Lewinellaceae bacterium]